MRDSGPESEAKFCETLGFDFLPSTPCSDLGLNPEGPHIQPLGNWDP